MPSVEQSKQQLQAGYGELAAPDSMVYETPLGDLFLEVKMPEGFSVNNQSLLAEIDAVVRQHFHVD